VRVGDEASDKQEQEQCRGPGWME